MAPFALPMAQPLYPEQFYHMGRGPILERLHWGARGLHLEAADYTLPDAPRGAAGLRHLRFVRAQVVAITPEEVIDYARLAGHDSGPRGAALLDLGRSAWLATFNPHHLGRCRHFQLLCYDQLLDVIAEDVTVHAGGFAPAP